jgi:hypothetical protein
MSQKSTNSNDTAIPRPDADGSIAIYLPSRYKDGQAIPPSLRSDAGNHISGFLSKLFNGTSKSETALGSFMQGEGLLKDFVVDEAVEVYRSFASKEGATSFFPKVLDLAAEVASKLSQESVGLEWFGGFYFVRASKAKTPSTLSFSKLPATHQRTMVAISLLRVRVVRDLILLLSLDGWTRGDAYPSRGTINLEVFAVKGQRRILLWTGAPQSELLRRAALSLPPGDILLDDHGPWALVYMVGQAGRLVGGKRFSFPAPEGRISRQTLSLALALLNSGSVLPLTTLLERHELTAHFFRSYTSVTKKAADEFREAGLGGAAADEEARLLIGRLMVLKFMEGRGILDGDLDFLRNKYIKRRGAFYKTELVPQLFEILDTPKGASKNRVLPYLNGGLFKRTPGWDVDLPNRLFDPDASESILGLFSRYDFSLSSETSYDSEDLPTIEPSVFGQVLESLCSEELRKRKGIHYTPDFIAKTLAREALIARLSTLSGIREDRLRTFRAGTQEALTLQEAERIKDLLPGLRILDPAAGSGALLLAMLEELMAFFDLASSRWGVDVKRGGPSWGRQCRLFVRE